MKYKFHSTLDSIRMLNNEFSQFEESKFLILFENQTKKKKVGEPYLEIAFWIHREKNEFALYVFDAFVNAGGHLSGDCIIEKKYFSELNEMYKWSKQDVSDVNFEKSKIFKLAEIVCIQRAKEALESSMPEKATAIKANKI